MDLNLAELLMIRDALQCMAELEQNMNPSDKKELDSLITKVEAKIITKSES